MGKTIVKLAIKNWEIGVKLKNNQLKIKKYEKYEKHEKY
jgi:hypothetical protein